MKNPVEWHEWVLKRYLAEMESSRILQYHISRKNFITQELQGWLISLLQLSSTT